MEPKERDALLGYKNSVRASFAWHQARNVKVKLFTPQQIRKVFFADGKGTKHALAEILAKWFPEELSFRLPRKRRPWTSEDYRMGIFDAVALVLAHRLKSERRASRVVGGDG